jgi:hypothetical protein
MNHGVEAGVGLAGKMTGPMGLQPLSPETAWALIAALIGVWQIYISKNPPDVFKRLV